MIGPLITFVYLRNAFGAYFGSVGGCLINLILLHALLIILEVKHLNVDISARGDLAGQLIPSHGDFPGDHSEAEKYAERTLAMDPTLFLGM